MSIAFKPIDDPQYVRTFVEREMGLLQNETQSYIDKLRGYQNYAITRGRLPIGFVSIRFEKRLLFLHAIVLEKRARRQRKISEKVMGRLEREATRRGKRGIYCYALKTDHQTLEWFKELGFSLTDQGRTHAVMEKNVADPRARQEDNYLFIHFPL